MWNISYTFLKKVWTLQNAILYKTIHNPSGSFRNLPLGNSECKRMFKKAFKQHPMSIHPASKKHSGTFKEAWEHSESNRGQQAFNINVVVILPETAWEFARPQTARTSVHIARHSGRTCLHVEGPTTTCCSPQDSSQSNRSFRNLSLGNIHCSTYIYIMIFLKYWIASCIETLFKNAFKQHSRKRPTKH